ncbi:hypothetical protein QFC22_000575 [Naganishia vaughanmartiniae]|uniref:Uncharacterized protein n=1 Tax=Naganishia vaughanmartiniae TaxID=1424756 RepID=A0ACC2XPV5_9TREE|nr:hypothetical protein QFC22_000575 [Naganishia vaughanmartiniae]
MSVHTAGGPWPAVSSAAENNHRTAPISRISTRASGEASRGRYPDEGRDGNEDTLDAEYTAQSSAVSSNKDDKRKWYQYLGRGMYLDVRNRLPYYVSDWTDAWNYRVVPATLEFQLTAESSAQETTGEYGVQEVLLSTFMAAFVASVFGGQPLLISGVTGPITVFNKTIYTIFVTNGSGGAGFNYHQFIGWVYLWGAIFHWITAFTNGVAALRYVTRFSCETFGFYVAWIYIQYGVQVVTRQFSQVNDTSAFLGIILALVTLVTPHLFNLFFNSTFSHRHVRRFAADYGMPITIIAASGLAYWGRFDRYVLVENMRLPTNAAFQPAGGREWLVRFWNLPGKYVGIAFPFGFVLFILFYFDANVSSLIAQGSEFPLRKPPGFHWDFFLLGITTFIAGLLGIPAPNGLIPQAPMHTAALVVMGRNKRDEETPAQGDGVEVCHEKTDEKPEEVKEVPVSVVEQRVSNLVQGSICLVLMTGPFQTVLGQIPKGVLAGLFWYMGFPGDNHAPDPVQSSDNTQTLVLLA